MAGILVTAPVRDRSTSDAQASLLAGELRPLLGRLRRQLREAANPGDFTPSQTSVLARLEREESATAGTLARAEGMRPQSMGAIVATLQAAGFVAGVPDPNDGRQTILSLTEHARNEIRSGRAAREDWLVRNISSKLSPDEQNELGRGIALLQRLLEP